ncbi:MAG: hypothetical protein GSR78_04595 [Desulfurococcales archaeon]|nr:hypothetical protein [Desulfurococcales archaeon]
MNISDKRMATTILAVLLVAGMAGAAALWYENLTVDVSLETGELDIEFRNNTVFTSDPCFDNLGNPITWPDTNAFPPDFDPVIAPEGKDVGCTMIEFQDTDSDGDMDYLNITLSNVYPYYATEVDFRIRNVGTIPLKIWKIEVILDNGTSYNFTEINPDQVETEGLYLDLDDDGESDVLFLWGDNFGVQLEPGDHADISLFLVVLQPAPENATLHFMVGLDAVQWNEYCDVVPLAPECQLGP